jgi:tetratricopeptide (TPR) repeat protein
MYVSAVYLAKEEWDKAEKDALKCTEINDSFVKGFYRLATAQMEQKKYDEAMETAKKGLAKNKGTTTCNNNKKHTCELIQPVPSSSAVIHSHLQKCTVAS